MNLFFVIFKANELKITNTLSREIKTTDYISYTILAD
jgi:hypothetical protein